MFSFGSKVKQKLSATRFEFSFVVHNLAPWPEGARAIAIGYQRGKRRRGATRSVYPSRQPGRLGTVVRFNERFDMPVTLYKASSGHTATTGGLGPFKKKCLILAVLETDGRTQATAALGRVVVDLSEYAAIEHQETRTFMVSCNKVIHAAVGDPQLMVTIRCRWKKLAREGGANPGSALPEENASMSTDTTGSRMTANLSSFLRFKFTGKGTGPMSEEQDLRGFEPSGGGAGGSAGPNGGGPRSVSGDPTNKVMDTIQESHDEPAEPVFAPAQGTSTPGGGSRTLTPQTSMKGGLTPASSSALERSPSQPLRSPGEPSPGPLEAAVMGMSLREMHAARAKAASTAASPRRLDPTGPGDSATSAPMGSYGARGAVDLVADRSYGSLVPAFASASNLSPDSDLLAALRLELLTAAALEAAIYLVRRPPGTGLGQLRDMGSASAASLSAASGPNHAGHAGGPAHAVAHAARAAHAPARRLARTVLCLGPVEGAAFGGAALRLVRAQVAAAGDGLDVLSYWWSNAVQLRAVLQGVALAAQLAPGAGAGGGGGAGPMGLGSMAGAAGYGTYGGGGMGGGGGEHWAAAALVPELRRIERSVFEELLGRLWERVLLPTVLGAGRGGGGKDTKPVASTKRALQEAATKKWFEGLEAVCSSLSRLGPGPGVAGGHSALLRQQVLLQCLKRVDLLLFAYLLGGAEQPGVAELLSDYDPHNALAGSGAGGGGGGGGGGGVPLLDDGSLPFARGVLTFGGGMSVKMTVTRLQQWAAAQPVLGGGGAPAAGSAPPDAVAQCATATDRSTPLTGSPGAGCAPPPPVGPLFPLLRASADLLMMPKELLLDRAVRLDVGAALSMRSVLHILERFQPDEFAQDCISPEILASLQDDAALPQMHLRAAAADVNSGYCPPHEALVLRGVEAGWEPGLEYDGDSEEELEELAQVVAKGSSLAGGTPRPASGIHPGGTLRFRMLHECWAAGMPRRRRPPSSTSMWQN